MKKKILLLITMLLLTSCGSKEIDLTHGTIENITYTETEEQTNYIKIQMESNDIILAELYPDIAPITIENIKQLISDKYYDNLLFHRVVKNFVIQTGDPTGTGLGGSENTITGEFRRNGITNTLLHERGVLSMARKQNDMDSASSQFFIVHKTNTSLDGLYAAFGKVIAGLDTVDKIADVEVDESDAPITEQRIVSIRFINIEK